MVFSTAKFNEVYFYNKEYLTFCVFPLRIQMILRTQFKGIGAFCKHKGPAGEVGGSSYTKPSVYLYSNFSECLLHSCVEPKTVCLLLTLPVSGSFIIKFLTCISRPLFRRRSCFMFMVPSRYFLSRRRAENVCYEVSNGMHSS